MAGIHISMSGQEAYTTTLSTHTSGAHYLYINGEDDVAFIFRNEEEYRKFVTLILFPTNRYIH